MNLKFLHLHLSQTEKALERAKNNNYSDQEKQDYQNSLVTLFRKIKQQIATIVPTDDDTIFEVKKVLDFIFKSLEFLDSSTLNLIPYEIIECLKCTLRDWTDSNEKYIIVTSLVNGISDFSLDATLISNKTKIYQIVNQRYNVEFKHKLVQINLPKALSRDYLVSVVLYHELGHFIDEKNNITTAIAKTLNLRLTNSFYQGNDLSDLQVFFPYIGQYSPQYQEVLLKNHFGEYFCDLFGSQYIGRSSNRYLLYLTENQNIYYDSHPSSTNRQKVVDDYLAGIPNIVVEIINEALLAIMNSSLSVKFEEVSREDFYNFLPPIIENERQLHGIFVSSWQLWQEDWETFRINMKIPEKPTPEKVYGIINNLIEKSIGNYIVQNKWQNSLPVPPQVP